MRIFIFLFTLLSLFSACKDELSLRNCDHEFGRFMLNDTLLDIVNYTSTFTVDTTNSYGLSVKRLSTGLERADGTHFSFVLYNWEDGVEDDCLESKSYFDDHNFNQCIQGSGSMICEGAWLSFVRNPNDAFSSQTDSSGEIMVKDCSESPNTISIEIIDFVMSNPATGERLVLSGCIDELSFEVSR